MGKVIYLKSEEDDSDITFLDTFFVTANESGLLKKMWTWLTIIFFLIGSSVSIFGFFWR